MKISNLLSKLAILLFAFTIFFIFGTQAEARRLYSQDLYKQWWCTKRGGEVEVELSVHVHCDCLTKVYSIEFDFAEKWAEAIGESLYFSKETGKKAGIVLILETKEDFQYWLRLNSTIKHHQLPIDTWIVTPADIEKK